MRSGAIPERFQQVTRVSLDNATILLQRSKCKKEDIIAEKKQPPSAPSPPSMDVPDPLEITVKAAIAKSVAEQFRRAGRYVSGEELSKIVDAEYTRVREQLPSEVMKEQQQVRPAAIQPSQVGFEILNQWNWLQPIIFLIFRITHLLRTPLGVSMLIGAR